MMVDYWYYRVISSIGLILTFHYFEKKEKR